PHLEADRNDTFLQYRWLYSRVPRQHARRSLWQRPQRFSLADPLPCRLLTPQSALARSVCRRKQETKRCRFVSSSYVGNFPLVYVIRAPRNDPSREVWTRRKMEVNVTAEHRTDSETLGSTGIVVSDEPITPRYLFGHCVHCGVSKFMAAKIKSGPTLNG